MNSCEEIMVYIGITLPVIEKQPYLEGNVAAVLQ